MFKLLATLNSGYTAGVRVQVGLMSDFINTASIRNLHFITPSEAGEKVPHTHAHTHTIHTLTHTHTHTHTLIHSHTHTVEILDINQVVLRPHRTSTLFRKESFLKLPKKPDSLPLHRAYDSIRKSRRTPPIKRRSANPTEDTLGNEWLELLARRSLNCIDRYMYLCVFDFMHDLRMTS